MLHRVVHLRETRVRPRSASGQAMPVVGQGVVALPGLPPHDYLVAQKLPWPVLLGADFCRENKVVIDYEGNKVRVGKKWRKGRSMTVEPCEVLIVDKTYDRLIAEFQEVFTEEDTLGKAASGVTMSLTTEGPPIRQRAYRIPLAKRDSVKKEITKLLNQGVIQHSSSPWSSPVVLVPKKDGSHRLCIDYRKLNAVTEKDSHPLPNIRDIFDQLEGATVFSLLDLVSGYHQIEMHPNSREKTAFSCHLGHFEYNRMPFGLCNAPSVFQRYMNFVLQGLIGKGCLVYLDDIVVYGRNRVEHDANLRKVLTRLRENQLRTKPIKCVLGEKSLKLLGHIVDEHGIHTDPEKCRAISEMTPPRDVPELRRFLGAAGYYRDLIPGFAKLASPLTDLTRKDIPYEWTPARQRAFELLKAELLSDHCVGYPDVNKPYNLYTDACDYAMGAVLTQRDEATGKEKAIYYISHRFNDVQKRWATIEKEAYAVVYAIDKLRPYVLGCPGITVYTDHKPLLCLFTEQMKNTKIQRWAILLEEFRVKITYIKGETNLKADFLSRLRHEELGDHEILLIDAQMEPYPRGGAEIEHIPTLSVLEMDEIPVKSLIRRQKAELPDEVYHDPDTVDLQGVVCSIRPPNKWASEQPRIILPEAFRTQVVKRAHKEVGHSAVARTVGRIREGYVWAGMVKQVTQYISKCPECLAHSKKRAKVKMGEGPLPALPDQVIALDLTGPFAMDRYGQKFVMVVIDHCSGWTEAYPLTDKSNAEVTRAFTERYLPYHASPYMVITDNGNEFSSDGWRKYLERHEIQHQLTTAYNPQSNGKVERANRALKEQLEKLVFNQTSRWSEYLPEVVKLTNAPPTRATGYPPFLLQTGRDPRLPITGNLLVEEGTDEGDKAEFLTNAIKAAHETQKLLREENRKRIDAKADAGEIHIGDTVMVCVETPGNNTSRWDHGFRVVRVSATNVWVTNVKTGGQRVLHRSKVKVIDPNIVWDHTTPRPTRYQLRKAIRRRISSTPEPEIRTPDAVPPKPSDRQTVTNIGKKTRRGRPRGGRKRSPGLAVNYQARPRKIARVVRAAKRLRSSPGTEPPQKRIQGDPEDEKRVTEEEKQATQVVDTKPGPQKEQINGATSGNQDSLPKTQEDRSKQLDGPTVLPGGKVQVNQDGTTHAAALTDTPTGRYNLRQRRGRIRLPTSSPEDVTAERKRQHVDPDFVAPSTFPDAGAAADKSGEDTGTRNPGPDRDVTQRPPDNAKTHCQPDRSVLAGSDLPA